MGTEAEGEGRGKLVRGIGLILHDPVWDRSCRECETHFYDGDGILKRLPNGKPMPRLPMVPTPCLFCPKIPDHVRSSGATWIQARAQADEMTPANRKAYRRFLEWDAVGVFPADPIVLWYSGLINDQLKRYYRDQQVYQGELLISLVKILAAKYGR